MRLRYPLASRETALLSGTQGSRSYRLVTTAPARFKLYRSVCGIPFTVLHFRSITRAIATAHHWLLTGEVPV